MSIIIVLITILLIFQLNMSSRINDLEFKVKCLEEKAYEV